MADARALLRAHRAENRIRHPHAAYSDSGKLLCKICHDVVKAESLWDTHIRSKSHKEKLETFQKQSQLNQGGDDSAHKRKRSEDVDEPMSDGDGDQDTARAKRSKTDAISHINTSNGAQQGTDSTKEKIQTPPGLPRRASGTPSHGVEIAIPSRPATPLAGSNSAVSTPKVTMHRPPFSVSDTSTSSGAPTAQLQAAASIPISNESLSTPASRAAQTSPNGPANAKTQQGSGTVDEAEWAAFEAEMSALESEAPAAPNGAVVTNNYADAVISAPALTAAQLAAKSQEEENERRKRAAEAEMADEREEATRALETEFEEMEELEGRVRRLKERREKLRKESVMNLRATSTVAAAAAAAGAGAGSSALKPGAGADGKENIGSATATHANSGEDIEEEDEEEDDDEEDEFDGFRFRV